MPHRIVATEPDRHSFIRFAEGVALPVTFEWVPGRDRTLDQNRLSFLWAREAAEQLGDRTPEEMRSEWKLRFGVPIMREDSPEFRETYDLLIKPLSYEQKLKAMDLIAVTSLMKVKQMIAFLDAVQRECAEQGIRLTDPDGELAAYQSRYRKDAA